MRLEDRQAVIDAIVYTALNPVKDGLVARVREWPAVNGLRGLLERRALGAIRPSPFFRPDGPIPEVVTLELMLPGELAAQIQTGVSWSQPVIGREVTDIRPSCPAHRTLGASLRSLTIGMADA